MTKSSKSTKDQKIKQIIDLLKFTMTMGDEEILRSSVESIIEQLEEIIK